MSKLALIAGLLIILALPVAAPAAAVSTPASRHLPSGASVGTPTDGDPAVAGPAPASTQAEEDIDAFMEKVLERRDVNWNELYDYVFTEVESLRIEGVEIAAMQSLDEEYTWFVRDGYLVRSPWKVNGVMVDAATREKAETDWIESVASGNRDPGVPRDSFFAFEFEPGNYFFAGRETLEGREVVRIEYYPENLFSDDEQGDRHDDEDAGRNDEEDIDEKAFEHMFDKTSLVTMLVLPEEHQIVKWTFENAGFEFLPYRWLVRMDEIRASMIMDEPVEGVWLPREIHAAASASTASFDVAVEYSRSFGDYKHTEVGAGVVFGRPIH